MTEPLPNTGIGGNNPPDDITILTDKLTEKYDPQLKRRDELLEAAKRVPEEITDDETAQKAVAFEKQLALAVKESEAIRKAEKEPYYEAGKTVDGWFKGLMEPLSAALKSVTDRRVAFQTAKVQAERKIRQAAEDKARREAEEAARKAAAAAEKVRGAKTLENALQAEEAAKEAQRKSDEAQQAAAAKPSDLGKIHSDLGVTGGLKMEWTGTITDLGTLDLDALRAYISYDELEKSVQRFAKQSKGKIDLAGAEIKEVAKGTRR